MSLKDRFAALCRRLKRQQALVLRQKQVVATSPDPIRAYTELDKLEVAELETRIKIDEVLDEHNAEVSKAKSAAVTTTGGAK